MDYFNPFQNATNPFIRQMPQQNQMQPAIDRQQFKQFAVTLNDNALNDFANMARQRGISEQDIQRGIQFIKSM